MSDASVKLTILYPNIPGSSVDWEYYLGPHLQLARRLLMPFGLQRIEIERGIGGISPGAPAPFHAIASLYFPSAGALQEALAQTAATLSADQRKYYTGESVVQISEAVQA